MNKSSLVAALAGALLFGSGASAQTDDASQESLAFTRQIAVDGTIAGSLEASTATAGVPAAAMVEALQAFATSIDLGREVGDGDRFHVRYEQTFTVTGTPIGTGRVVWAELRTLSLIHI